MLIGIDFDNTIARYDALFVDAARRLFGLVMTVPPDAAGSVKTAIRDALRAQPGGERRWQRLQADVYGRRMAEAEPMPGADRFLRAASDRGLPLCIISHKSQYAAADPGGVDLRQAALAWLQAHGLLDPARTGLTAARVHFEDTRRGKIGRIAATGCTHFIDDLREVLTDPGFPTGVRRYLLGPALNDTAINDTVINDTAAGAMAAPDSGTRDSGTADTIRAFSNWREISDDILDRTAA